MERLNINDIPKLVMAARPGDEVSFADAMEATRPWNIPDVVVIKVASVGNIISKGENPNQPVLPEENLRTVMEAIETGASGIHFNPTTPRGKRVNNVDAYRALIQPCREKYGYRFVSDCNILLGDTFAEQLAPVTAGLAETVPSAMFHPRKWIEGAARLMLEHNCKFEMVAHCSGEVELAYRLLIKPGLVKKPYNWLIMIGVPSIAGRLHEYLPNPRAMCEALLLIVNRIKEIDEDSFIMVCCAGRATRYLSNLAMLLGLHVRVGTEDTKWLYPHKEEVIESNVELIKDHIEMARLLGRRLATGNEYRQFIGLPER